MKYIITLLCCLVIITVTTAESVCNLPVDEGTCRADMTRYAYNPGTGECEEFDYGGCDGNGNNFMTKSECEKACKK